MRYLPVLPVLAFLLFATESAQAFPQAVAGFILGRPVTESSVKEQMRGMDDFAERLIESTEAISVTQFPVGEPQIKLSVLVVEPRRYGVDVREKIEIKEGNKVNYSLSINVNGGSASESANQIIEKLKAEAKDGNGNSSPTPEQMVQFLQEQARAGGSIPTTDQPRTVFLLLGYGVPKSLGLPIALLLADHGIRTVIPDLRGQGDSEGKGVTWGKSEPDDLADLLTAMHAKGIVQEDAVGVLGVSYGAAMASLWAAQDSRVEAAVLAAPYQRADTKIATAAESFMGNIKLPFKLKKETLLKGTEIAAKRLKTTWEDISPDQAVTKIQKPVLFLASSGDEIIPQKEVEELHRKGPEGSKLHVYENLPHLLLGLNFTGIESVVVEWFQETGFLEP